MKKTSKKKTPGKKTWHAEVVEIPRSPEDIAREEQAVAIEKKAAEEMLDVFNDGDKAFHQGEAFTSNPHSITSRLGLAWLFGWRRAETFNYLRDANQDLCALRTWIAQAQNPDQARLFNVNINMRLGKPTAGKSQ